MKIKFLFIAFTLLASISHAQELAIKKGDKKYEKYAYIDAIKIYETIAAKGYKEEKMFQKLGNAYYFNAELEKAETAYQALFAINPAQNAEYLYRYAQTLKSIGKYAKANEMLEKFKAKSASDQRAILLTENQNYLEVIKANSNRFVIEDAGINSIYSDFGSAILGTTLVFASTRNPGNFINRKMKWNNQYFTNIYSVQLPKDTLSKIGIPKKFSKKINSKFNESSAFFTKDGNTMYLTRNNFKDGKVGKNDNQIILLKLYQSKFVNNKWQNATELPFNSNQYSTAHPALSADEKTLYFASDMPGSFGASDLYKVAINEDGTFGTPINLGASINTPGRETFPFVSDDNDIYFASDGHPGLGGLDVFVAKIPQDGVFKNIQNVGRPINSEKDDFAYYLITKTQMGYFTSNRLGGQGFDDIYKFTELHKLTCEQVLTGIVADSDTNLPIANVEVTLFDSNGAIMKTVNTDANGNYNFGSIDCDLKLFIRASKTEYETNELSVKTGKMSGNKNLPFMLKKRFVKIEIGNDLANKNLLDIPIIHFDLDQFFIREDAAFELEKIIALMKLYPALKIDIRSHTDSRQTAKYNLLLSENRAKSTMEWMIKNGINAERLTAKGYGESQLLNSCSDGVKCTEAEHEVNRRSEFIVVSM